MKRPLFDPPKSLDEQVLNAENRGDDLQRHARIGKMCGCGGCFCCAALRRRQQRDRILLGTDEHTGESPTK